MNHFLENSLILAVLFILIGLPVGIAFYRSGKTRKKKIAAKLHQIEQETKLDLQLNDTLDSFVIALDKARKQLVLLNLADYSVEQIDLREVMVCGLKEKKQGHMLQSVALALTGQKQSTKEIFFYRQYQSNDWQLKRSALLAEQWNILINQTLRFND